RAGLPDGTVVLADGRPHLLADGRLHAFSFNGWGPPVTAPADVQVLTPPTSVAALARGFVPVVAGVPS
ncbi:MAG: hypothetical protein H0U89_07745, partial [Acidimicrobiia bacterium]|nr:hypothetical protein [Acidimicrobiia bacterium]